MEKESVGERDGVSGWKLECWLGIFEVERSDFNPFACGHNVIVPSAPFQVQQQQQQQQQQLDPL
jgi:hypothetical protein